MLYFFKVFCYDYVTNQSNNENFIKVLQTLKLKKLNTKKNPPSLGGKNEGDRSVTTLTIDDREQ